MEKISLGLFLTVFIFSVVLLVSGCGRKGPPEPPAGSTYPYPRPYPSEQ